MLLAFPDELHRGIRHLQKHDLRLAHSIDTSPMCTITPHTDYYGALINAIIGQQLSVKAAAAIRKRFLALFDDTMPIPQQILATPIEAMRAIGLSYAKAGYVHDLAGHILDGSIHFDKLADQTNEQIIHELTDVKGVGEWTVHMFLIFCVGRLDVLPIGDLGIRNGVGRLYELPNTPSPSQVSELAAHYSWSPYRSIASWYIWRSLDNEPTS